VQLEKIFKRLTGAAIFVLDPTDESNLVCLAADSGFRKFTIDAQQIKSKEELLEAFAETLSFPEYFGHNWDALEECIRDLTWLPRTNFLLVFQHADSLLGLGAKELAVVISILGEATFSWKAEGIVFSVVLLGGPALAAAVGDVLEAKN
jgi:RNAse (barnase) inhibitor barstar